MFSLSRWLRHASACGITASTLLQSSFAFGQAESSLPKRAEVGTPIITGVTEPLGDAGKKAQPEPLAPPTKTESVIVTTEEPKSAWLTHPHVRPAPRSGNFPMPAKGCGYYSGLDWLQGTAREAPQKNAYPAFAFFGPGFFDTDWRFVDQPGFSPDIFESMHRIHLGNDWMVGTGGQAWWRHMRETSSRLTGNTNEYDLFRARVYGDVWYRDTFRIYAEFITAHNINPELAPLRIDENRADILNLFADIKVGQIANNPLYLRVGRQELNLGSTRLVSSLDWANNRRTFEGLRLLYSSEKVDADVFFTRPVINDARRFDFADSNQNFGGAFVTYRPKKGQAIDAYYLYLDNHNNSTVQGITTLPTQTHTVGGRYSGDKDGFLWDIEGSGQFGARGANSIFAGTATAGVGYNWSKAAMNPTVWAYYDWASGDASRNVGNFNTFNQQFPFGHYYLGFADIIGRQNVRDVNMHLYLHPAKWITFNMQYHFLSLDKADDALYGVASNVVRVSPNASAGGVVGQEIDLLLNFHLTKNSDFVLGYSRLQAGEFIRNTGNGRDPELFYAMYSFRW